MGGDRTESTHIFDEVVIPAEIMMDKENQGVEIIMPSTFPSHHSYKTAVGK